MLRITKCNFIGATIISQSQYFRFIEEILYLVSHTVSVFILSSDFVYIMTRMYILSYFLTYLENCNMRMMCKNMEAIISFHIFL